MSAAVDLSVRLGPLELPNPILTASGTFGYGLEFAGLKDLHTAIDPMNPRRSRVRKNDPDDRDTGLQILLNLAADLRREIAG